MKKFEEPTIMIVEMEEGLLTDTVATSTQVDPQIINESGTGVDQTSGNMWGK